MTNTQTTQGIEIHNDGSATFTAAQVEWLRQTVRWNVDMDTVRFDNGDEDRADFLDALRATAA